MRVLRHDVHVPVSLTETQIYKAGTKSTKELEKLITNPKAFVEKEDAIDVPAVINVSTDATGAGDENKALDYRKLKKDDIVALAKDRGVDSTGTIPAIAERLEAQDTEKAKEDAGDPDVRQTDFFALALDELRKLATERNVAFDNDTTDIELATLLDSSN